MRSVFAGCFGDLRFAFRQALRRPLFAALAVVVLAAGIGPTVAVFSVMYQALWKPLPYPEPEQLVVIHNIFPRGQVPVTNVSAWDYVEIGRQKDAFESAGIYFFNDLTLTGAGPARHVDVVNASASLFQVLRATPALGRLMTSSDDTYGSPGVLLLSDAFWRRAFGGDPRVVGRTVRLNEVPYTVIGVMRPEFQFPYATTQLWVPTTLRPVEFSEQGRPEKWLHMVSRIARGADITQVDAALRISASHLARRLPAGAPENAGWHLAARPLADEQTEGKRHWLWLAFGAVFGALLIACSNVSGLLLIRATARQGERALRTALGATRYRIARQALIETALLASAACGLGLLLAVWCVYWLNSYGPLGSATRVGAWPLLFALATSLFSTLSAGLLPALTGSGLPVEQALRAGAAHLTTGGVGRHAIVAAQIAIAATLLFTATLLGRSFVKLMQVPTGFDPAHVWSGAIEFTGPNYRADDSWNTRFFMPLQERLSVLAGVEAASAANALPFNPSGVWTEDIRLPGHGKLDSPAQAQIGVVLPRYFETVKIPLLRGRTFTAADRSGAPLVAVINAELGRRYFPGEDPLGKLIGTSGPEEMARIIGVVGNVRNTDLGGPLYPELYLPEFQHRADAMYLVIRTRNDEDVTATVRAVLAGLDSSAVLYDVAPMEQRVTGSLHLRRFVAFLLNGFADLGLALAAVGLYAALAHTIELRRREIGIRMALGARPSRVMGMVIKWGLVLVASGLAVGIAGALAAARLIRGQLFGVDSGDAKSWAVVLTVLAAGAVIAVWLPVRKATAVDPATALQQE